MNLKALVGSGDKIGLFTLPFLIIGLILNIAFPARFSVGGPPSALRVISIVVLIVGIAVWAWSVVLILTAVPRGELITSGAVLVGQASSLHKRGASGASVDGIPVQHMVGSRDRDRALHRVPEIRRGGRNSALKDVRRSLE